MCSPNLENILYVKKKKKVWACILEFYNFMGQKKIHVVQ